LILYPKHYYFDVSDLKKRMTLSNVIREGDDVLLYLDQKRTYLVKVEKERKLHTHKGFIQVEDLIGKDYGTRVTSSMDICFVALRPIIRDHLFKMQRNTQILYPKDVGLIILLGGVGPGSKIVEAGTGTGALTGVLAHFVKPNGYIFSYELREAFIEGAIKNLKRVNALEHVQIKNANIVNGISERDVDIVVLDLATPWLVVSHAYQALIVIGMFVSFSPTIDQVIKTTEALEEIGFVDVKTVESLLRRMQVSRGKTRPESLMTGHTGYLTFARKALFKKSYPADNNIKETQRESKK
jgi:tRNA (adenine57-N1/adenine58-N1)-methyltransferase